MIVLDENILYSQRELLKASGFSARQIGYDLLVKGIKDEQIIVELRRLRSLTFFTRDSGFYQKTSCHRNYCLAVVNTNQYEVAAFVRAGGCLALRTDRFNGLPGNGLGAGGQAR